METLYWIIAALIFGGLFPALKGFHLGLLSMEKRGWIYYWHRKPGGSPAGCFTPLQEAFEPQARHVFQAKENGRVAPKGVGAPPHPEAKNQI